MPDTWTGRTSKRDRPRIYRRDRLQSLPGDEPSEVNTGRRVRPRTSEEEYSSSEKDRIISYIFRSVTNGTITKN